MTTGPGEGAPAWRGPSGIPDGDDVWRTMADRHVGPVRRVVRARPVLMDVVVCAVYLVVSVVSLATSAASGGGAVLSLGTTAVVLVALFFRRRYPFLVLAIVAAAELAGLLLAAPLGSQGAGIWFALYAVARQYAAARVYTVALVVTALEGVGVGVWYLRTGALDALAQSAGAGVVPVALVVGVGVYVGTNAATVFFGSWVRNQRLHEAELQGWARRAQELARGRERNRIAGEMHDIVAHSLSVMIALSDGARRVSGTDPERAGQVMGEVSKAGRAALADLRRSLGVLRGEGAAPLSPGGTGEELEVMLDGFRAAGLPVRMDRAGELPEDPARRLTTVRIIQESLTNALRYAREPSEVLVWLRCDVHGVHVRVRDDGRHASRRPRSQGSGIGLSGMVERAQLFGGSVAAGPLQGGGWGVEAWLPAAPEGNTTARARRENGGEG